MKCSSCNWGYTVVAWCLNIFRIFQRPHCALLYYCHEHNFKKQVSGNSPDWLTALGSRKIYLHLNISIQFWALSRVPCAHWFKKWRARDWVQCPVKLWGFPSWLNGRTSFLSLQPPVMEFLLFSPPFAIFLQAAAWAKRGFASRQTRAWILGLLFFISFLLVTLP